MAVVSIILLACSPEEKPLVVEPGDLVSIDYVISRSDGSVFDSSEKYGGPIGFKVGNNEILPGVDRGVRGMRIGEEKTLHLAPLQAYGEYDRAKLQAVPLQDFPAGPELREGMSINLQTRDGKQADAVVRRIGAKNAVLDFNHPLAGQLVAVQFKVVEIIRR